MGTGNYRRCHFGFGVAISAMLNLHSVDELSNGKQILTQKRKGAKWGRGFWPQRGTKKHKKEELLTAKSAEFS